uniref:Kaptin n=1 Tax=Timema shepardi TaxID=629360 RepID=A0A7R9ARY0_TIMSH|nr:unnamed protein product [Timema shepardi]
MTSFFCRPPEAHGRAALWPSASLTLILSSQLRGAEIISIDAFTKSKSSDDFVIGITIIKCGNNEHSHETYLHIYSEWEPSSEFNMESAAQNCQMLELDFIPYQLYHTELLTGLETDDNNEVVWLLSGSDEKVHLFREDRLNHCYIKAETEDYFPELSRAPSIVMWMDVHHTSDYAQRVTAFGCECGYVKLTVINVPRNEIISDCSIRFESSVTSVALFNDELKLRCPSFINLTDVSPADEEEPSLHLLVTTTLQPAVIYRNITVQGFESCYNLPDSDSFDAVMCCLVADIDMDGKQEVILGTYGQEMLVYKLESSSEDGKESWQLNCQRGFSNPIYSLLYVDVTGDGVKDLVVLTLQGVHIMQKLRFIPYTGYNIITSSPLTYNLLNIFATFWFILNCSTQPQTTSGQRFLPLQQTEMQYLQNSPTFHFIQHQTHEIPYERPL